MGQSTFAEDKQSLVNSPLKVEGRSVLSKRTNSVPSEITEEEDDPLGDQIRQLKVLFLLLLHSCKVSSITYLM